MRSCRLRLSRVEAREITTIEGLSPDRSHALQRAWIEEEVPQCGYCQSGQLMQAASLLASNPSPTREEIVSHMDGVLCRCGTYGRIIRAIERASAVSAAARREDPMSARTQSPPRETSPSRRTFLKQAGGGLSFVLVFGPAGVAARRPDSQDTLDALMTPGTPDAPAAEHPFGAWVRIATDGQVLIYNPAAEMGQGSMTALPVILAEEMDADWDKVRIEHSPVEPAVYGRSWSGRGRGGSMMTAGSMAVRGYYMNLRLAGAQIRRVLLDNVAREWGVSVGETGDRAGRGRARGQRPPHLVRRGRRLRRGAFRAARSHRSGAQVAR